MPITIDRAVCPKCGITVQRLQNDETFWCSCGRHWKARQTPTEDDETVPERSVIAIEVPDIQRPPKPPSRGKIRGNTKYVFENRRTYLIANRISELDIFEDAYGNEYWIKDNFHTGESHRISLPVRFKVQKGDT